MTIESSLQLLGAAPKALQDIGWETHFVFCPDDSGQSSLQNLSNGHSIFMKREPDFFSDFVALFRWVFLFRRIRPGVVSVGTPKAGFIGILAAWITRVPARVYVLRGLRLETAGPQTKFLLSVAEYLATSMSTHVLSVSASLRDTFIEKGLDPSRKAVVLGSGSSMGVDTERFRPVNSYREKSRCRQLASQIGLRDGFFTVGYFGRHHPDKGERFLLEALESLAHEGFRIQLLLVGNDDTGGKGLGVIDSSVLHVVSLPRTQNLEKFYALLDVFCLPSLREGFPNVLLEAQSCGIPVVACDVTGSKDALLDGITGLLVKPRSAESLKEGIRTLISSETDRTKMGKRGREWVVENYEQSRVVEDQVVFYETARMCAE